MDIEITPDAFVYWSSGPFHLNATIVFTWVVMAILVIACIIISRRLTSDTNISRGQNVLEVIVSALRGQIHDVSEQAPDRYVPFIGTLFLFIAVSNFLEMVPGYHPPTGSLSTTAALAVCVMVAVPMYGIRSQGLLGYFKHYASPTPFMAPFHVIGEFSRTLALAVRLFGNVMSGTMVIAILLTIVPLFIPVVFQALELLIGLIQSYIFAVLAMVYIASAHSEHEVEKTESEQLATQ